MSGSQVETTARVCTLWELLSASVVSVIHSNVMKHWDGGYKGEKR
jgi:hypothetical protein